MALRTNYADGGATATASNITAADMNAISAAINALTTVTRSSAATLPLAITGGSGNSYVYTGATATTWTLPPVAGNAGVLLVLENAATAAAGVITLNRQGTDILWFLSGLTTLTIGQGGSLILVCDGTQWNALSLDLANNVIGILPTANGGTGNALGTAWNAQSYVRFSRHATTTVAVTSGSSNLIASSYYDTSDATDANYTFTAASNNKIAVTAAGLYYVEIQVMSVVTAVTTAINLTNVVLYKGSGAGASAIYEHSASVFSYDVAGNRYVNGQFILPLAANDFIQPGIYHVNGGSTAMTITGEATGAGAYMKMARVA